MKTLWQVLGEDMVAKPFSKIPKDYWNDERRKTLKSAVESGKTNKEIVRDHFPELDRNHINRAIKMHPEIVSISRHKNGNERDFLRYWTPERKYVLKRAVNSSKYLEDVHLDHFSDTSFNTVRAAVKRFRKELNLKVNTRGGNNYGGATLANPKGHSPIDHEAKQHIISDLGKTGATVESIARKHYASPASVKRLRSRYYPKHEITHSEVIPPEHIDFVKSIRSGQAPVQKANPEFSRPKVIGARRIARELNKKFPGSQYQHTHVMSLIRNGTFALEGERVNQPKVGKYAERRKAIWQAHQDGVPHDVISKTHGMKPSNVRSVIDTMSRAKSRVVDRSVVKEARAVYLKPINEMNDNPSYQDHLTHWEQEAKKHAHKTKHHQGIEDTYQESGMNSKFREENQKNLKYHQIKLANANFQVRKYKVLSGAI